MVKLSSAPEMIANKLLTSDGQSIIVVRGTDHCEIDLAVLAHGVVEVDRGDGLVTLWKSDDFLVRSEDYIFAGEQSRPQSGDVIQRLVGGTLFQHEVCGPTSEDCFRYCDPQRTLMRVHTRLVDE